MRSLLIILIILLVVAGTVWYALENPNSLSNSNGSSANTIENVSRTVHLKNGDVSRTCKADQDCILVTVAEDLTNCCRQLACPYYGNNEWVSVNNAAYLAFKASVTPETCSRVDCPALMPPLCLEHAQLAVPNCKQGLCVKVTQ